MEKLNVRFGRKVNLQIDDINEGALDSVSPSMIARAAMQIGLTQLRALSNEGAAQVSNEVTIQNLKALN